MGRKRWDEVDTRWGDVDTRIRVHPDPRVGLPTEVVRAQRPGSGGRSRALFHQAIFRVTRAETETSKCPNSLFPQLPVSPTPLCPRKGCRCFEGASLPRRAPGGMPGSADFLRYRYLRDIGIRVQSPEGQSAIAGGDTGCVPCSWSQSVPCLLAVSIVRSFMSLSAFSWPVS
jgi:hypothetical protein